MGSNSIQDRLLPHAESLISRKAKSLIGKYGLVPSDFEDIRQSLFLDLLCKADRFDPDRGSEIQFVTTIVHRRIAGIVEKLKTQKRGWGKPHVSMDEEVETNDGESVLHHEVVDKETYLGATRGTIDPARDRLEAIMDLELIQKGLHPDQCELLTILLTHTPSEAARKLGIPRTTLNDRLSKMLAHLRKTKKWG